MTVELDASTIRELLAGPGVDTRQWVSYGVVIDPGEGRSPIEFDETEYRQPLVEVNLLPSSIGVRCRVAMGVAGDGEGEWYPFIPGDEVIVVLPEGNEKSGAVIIGRLANSLDKFPTRVAGNDVHGNTFGFKRMVAPYIVETGSNYLIRQVSTGAYLSITSGGDILLENGEGGILRLGASVQGFQSNDGLTVMQVDENTGNILLQAGQGPTNEASILQLARGGDCYLQASGNLYLTGYGSAPLQHNVSLEQVITLLVGVLSTMPMPAIPGPPLPPPLAEALVGGALAVASSYPLTVSLPLMYTALAVPQNSPAHQYGVGSQGVLVG